MQICPMDAQGRGLKPGHRNCGDHLSVGTVKVELGNGLAADKHPFKYS
jgi:hypothetical protein